MKRLALLAALLFLPLTGQAQTFLGFVGVPLLSSVPQVSVPDVVGLSANAADTAFEAVGLDTGTITQACSAEPANEVLSQDPTAATLVDPGTLVDLHTSSGASCTWDFSGIPEGWYSMAYVLADQDFMREARVEADGAAEWAYWLPGAPHGTANLRLDYATIRAEANGAAAWARWAPGTTGQNTGNLQLNMVLALTVNFQ